MDQRAVTVGQWVEFIDSVERYPHAAVEIGETGQVAVVSEGFIAVRLDQHHEGLDSWDNELHFAEDMDGYDEFFTATRDLPTERTPEDFVDALGHSLAVGDYVSGYLVNLALRGRITRLITDRSQKPFEITQADGSVVWSHVEYLRREVD